MGILHSCFVQLSPELQVLMSPNTAAIQLLQMSFHICLRFYSWSQGWQGCKIINQQNLFNINISCGYVEESWRLSYLQVNIPIRKDGTEAFRICLFVKKIEGAEVYSQRDSGFLSLSSLFAEVFSRVWGGCVCAFFPPIIFPKYLKE